MPSLSLIPQQDKEVVWTHKMKVPYKPRGRRMKSTSPALWSRTSQPLELWEISDVNPPSLWCFVRIGLTHAGTPLSWESQTLHPQPLSSFQSTPSMNPTLIILETHQHFRQWPQVPREPAHPAWVGSRVTTPSQSPSVPQCLLPAPQNNTPNPNEAQPPAVSVPAPNSGTWLERHTGLC